MGTYQIIKELARSRKISIAQLERELDLSNGIISKWDKVKPNSEPLSKVADYFQVSTDYLLGRKTEAEENAPKWATEHDILELDKMLNSNVNMSYGGENLTEEEKQRVKDVLTGIFWEKLEKQKKSEK